VKLLSSGLILQWAEDFRGRTGQWPLSTSGRVPTAPQETWLGIDKALRRGRRGLLGGSSLARLLAAERGVRNRVDPPPLTEATILAWADAFFERCGHWPHAHRSPIPESPRDTWAAIDAALRAGFRGLPGGSSLARLLLGERGVTHHLTRPPLTESQILSWADAYHQREGAWPNINSGKIPESVVDTWRLVDNALRHGYRGLEGASSLARLLARTRGVRVWTGIAPLTEAQILEWADTYRARWGKWPNDDSGPF
jgi:hypothetical protein